MYCNEIKVIGTCRHKDETISHLVLETTKAIDMQEAIRRAKIKELYTYVGLRKAYIIAVDQNGDGIPDYVKTDADSYLVNNLLSLPTYTLA